MFTILHLSDLHRAPDDPIGNAELLSTIEHDIDHWEHEDPAIAHPDALVVSGDLVFGLPLGESDYKEKLKSQYEDALEFLVELTNRRFEGDRSRVALVPGNHDVCWNTSREAMVGADAVMPKQESVPQLLERPQSVFRWSWRDLKLYRVEDAGHYRGRLDPYRSCVADFYKGSEVESQVDPSRDFNVLEFCDGRIGIATLNSCHGNDCFSRQGRVDENVLGKCDLFIRDSGRNYDLKIAVWHHDVDGGPSRDDYMDIGVVHKLIAKGFRMGLHGHQHRSEMTARTIAIPPTEQRMVVAAAGSLCAGPRDLPAGVNRQYNVIELDLDKHRARVHVREVSLPTVFSPAMRPEFGGKSFIDLSWTRELSSLVAGASDSRAKERELIEEAERALKEGKLGEAAELLRGSGVERDPYGRRLVVEVGERQSDWQLVCDKLGESQNILESFALARAAAELGNIPVMEAELVRAKSVFEASDASMRDVTQLVKSIRGVIE